MEDAFPDQGGFRPLDPESVFLTHQGVIRALYAQAVGWNMKNEPPDDLHDDCAQVFALGRGGNPRVERLNVNLKAP